MLERTTDEGYDQHQETTPPVTTNLITNIPHLIWVMGKLSFIYVLSDSLVLLCSLVQQPKSLLHL